MSGKVGYRCEQLAAVPQATLVLTKGVSPTRPVAYPLSTVSMGPSPASPSRDWSDVAMHLLGQEALVQPLVCSRRCGRGGVAWSAKMEPTILSCPTIQGTKRRSFH